MMEETTITKLNEIEVQAQPDHLDSLSKANPFNALAEIIWNAFDADAHVVTVSISENSLGAIEEIKIEDNGHGLPYDDAEEAFGHLGGSWKRKSGKTKVEERMLHGKEGKGRFKAFALGQKVSWKTTYATGDGWMEYEIHGNRSDLKKFSIEQPRAVKQAKKGTIVRVSEISESLGVFGEDGSVVERLTEMFALYLRDYPSVHLYFRHAEITPALAQKDFKEYHLKEIDLGDGKKTSAILQIVEWHSKRDRKLCLCNEGGFTLHEIDSGVRPGAEFQFTAYLRSPAISELHQKNRLEIDELDPVLRVLVEAARSQMRNHFRAKRTESAADLVKEWKAEGIYPYKDDANSLVETTRRQMFDICALNVHEYLSDFRSADIKSRKFTFRMLREALEDSPAALQKIFHEVLELPKNKQEELAELLDKTTLSAIIEANKLVTDRLAFLKGFEEILFDTSSKKELKERSQLHRILEQETWIFGEEFHLAASDETLTTVLKKHIGKLRPGETISEVTRDDGRGVVIDLLLGCEIPQNYKNRREFLVVELKRPSQNIDLDVKAQIESYALAVVDDERFDTKNTHWTFLAVSNEMSDQARKTISQQNLPFGFFHVADNFKIGLATWAEIIQQVKSRLEVFRDKLNYTATTDEGISLLKRKYEQYLPPTVRTANGKEA